jgi:hypothetical protein
MKAKVVLFALAAAALAVPAFAQESAAPPAQLAQSQPPKHKGFDPDEVVCRSEDVTDSHLGAHKVCMRWKDWVAEEDATEQDMNQFTRQPAQGNVGMGPAKHQ